MTQIFLFTDDYPFSADFSALGFSEQDQIVLVTRCPDTVISPEQRRYVSVVVKVESFVKDSLIGAIDNHVVVHPDALAISHDDFIYSSVAGIVDHYGIRGLNEAGVAPFIDKAVAKALLASEHVAFPDYFLFERSTKRVTRPASVGSFSISDLRFPAFVKPTVGAGAEHASVIESQSRFLSWCDEAQLPDCFEVDEYISAATLFHCELLIDDNGVWPIQVCEYSSPCADFALGRPVGSYTMDMISSDAGEIAGFAKLSLDAMGKHISLPRGVVHLEIFRKANGQLLFLEAQLRPPGANAKKLYMLRYGTDLEAAHLRLQMGQVVQVLPPNGPYAAWIYFPTKDGRVTEIRDLPKLSSAVVECNWYVRRGQKMRRPRSILDALGRDAVSLSIVISNCDYDRLRRDFFILSHFDPITVLDEISPSA